ncbi:MAG: ribosomal protein S18-alanine N-acetyltransferase [Gammaproteobacteria bacterium]
MTPDDLDVVLVNEVAAYPFPWTRGNFEDCLKERRDCRLLLAPGPAVCGPAVCGPAVFGHGVLSVAAGEAHVLNVCVAPVCQGRGYGRALLDHLLGRAQEQGAEVVFLEVRPSNGVAIALYESVGFNEIGRRRNYYQAAIGHEDALVMALDLRLLDPAFGAASA